MLAEKLSNKKKIEVARTASATLERAREIYQKSLVEKQLKPEKIEKLLNKYQQMAKLAKQKIEAQEEKCRKKRAQYLDHLKKTELARNASEEKEKEYASNILQERELKEKRAHESKQYFFQELQDRLLSHDARIKEAQERVKHMKAEENLERTKILEKEAVKTAQAEQIKLYQKQVSAIRAEAAIKLRMSEKMGQEEDYSNPYIVAEMRATQLFMRRTKGSPKLDTSTINKTSCNFSVGEVGGNCNNRK